MSMMQVTFLGTGTSTGIPQIGCTCPVCTSTDPRDSRLRTSAIVEIEGKNILIDCGPERTQIVYPSGMVIMYMSNQYRIDSFNMES